jgi:hypothetical protein
MTTKCRDNDPLLGGYYMRGGLVAKGGLMPVDTVTVAAQQLTNLNIVEGTFPAYCIRAVACPIRWEYART